MATDHLDKRTVTREGWFQKGIKDKGEINKPIGNYVSECKKGGRGYLGPWFEAHHILPQTSIESSIDESGKDQRYIEDVQYITPWNINSKKNLMGLPTYIAYEIYFQGKAQLNKEVDEQKIKKRIGYHNEEFSLASRRKWVQEIKGAPPLNHPIHQPVSWGHAVYNEEIIQEIIQDVWNKINDQKKNHQLDKTKVAKELNSRADVNHDYLKKRGKGADAAKWDRRKDPDDDGWYKPFTMADVSNPIFG